MDVLVRALVERFKEAATSLSQDDIRKHLSDSLQADNKGTGNYAYLCDVYGDDDSGDVVYSDSSGLKKAPYSMGTVGGKRAASIDHDSAVKVLPHMTYDTAADDSDQMTAMESSRFLGLFERFVSKGERDKASAGDFAGKGKSFPILKPSDVMAAVHSVGRAGAGNYSTDVIMANIKKIAKRKGFPVPDSMKDDADKKEAKLASLPTGEVILCESVAFTEDIPLKESAARTDYAVKIISPGRGSTGYYTKEMLSRDGPKVFTKGTHMYWNHATPVEEAQRPEGNLDHLAAVLTEDAKWNDTGKDGPGLYARAKVFSDYADKVQEKAPHTGLSIRAYGNLSQKKAPDGLGELIENMTRADSVDFVTRAGRDGKFLTESARAEIKEGEQDMDEAQVKRLIEAEVGPLKAENIKLRERLAMSDEIPALLKECFKGVKMEQPTADRISRRVVERATFKADGYLDVEALKKIVEAEIKDEGEYLSRISGGRIVVGMGHAASAIDPKKIEEAEKGLDEAFDAEMKSLSLKLVGDGDSNKAKRKALREGRAA